MKHVMEEGIMAKHDDDARMVPRRELKNAIAEYLYGSGLPA